MQTSTASVLAKVPPDTEQAVRNGLSEVDCDVRVASSTADVVSEITDRHIDCVVYAASVSEDLCVDVAALRSEHPAIPVVVLLDEVETPPSGVLEAGASECVRTIGEEDEWIGLLGRRVEAVLREHARLSTSAGSSDATAGTDAPPELVALFDSNHRHLMVAGDQFANELGSTGLEGTTLADLDVAEEVRQQLDENYAAALDGELRSQEVGIDSTQCTVETRPLPRDGGSFGVARYVPTGGTTHPAPVNRGVQNKVQRVHEVASTLDEQSRESAICRIAIESANDVLGFDACIVAEAENDEFVPLAATANEPGPGRSRLGTEDGIAGRTFQTGEAVLAADVRESSGVSLTDVPYRSVLSIPMGDFGVFQALSTEVGAYDEGDLDLGELLVAHVAHAITRVRYEQALTRERDQFAALFENIRDAAIKYVFEDGQPRIEAVNSSFVEYFGYGPDDAVGRTTLDLLVPDAERDAAAEMYATIRDGERLDREVERMTTDGPAPFLLRSVPVSSDDGNSRGYIVFTDIGELVERRRELERQNERLDTFASVVSHDLRNPLSAARGYLELALETGNLEHLDVVQEEHDRMIQMIDNLLTLAREGEVIGEVESVELATVVDDSWETVDTKAATLSVGDLPVVEGDRGRIQQLFENLFRNSIVHAGDDVAVTVDSFENGFYVADDGPGVPDDVKDDVLEMGVSTAKGDGGTGFGLAIVTEVAGGHGWTVEVTDSASGGARFEFRTTANADDTRTDRV